MPTRREQFKSAFRNSLKMKLADTHIILRIRLLNENHDALIRKTLTVGELQGQLIAKFPDQLQTPEKYCLVDAADNNRLHPDWQIAYLSEQGIGILRLALLDTLQSVTSTYRLTFLEEDTGERFEFDRLPIQISRSSQSNTEVQQLDLGKFKEGLSVSRPHARVFESDGRIYIENLTTNNRVLVNGKPVTGGNQQEIANGDALRIGKIVLTCQIAIVSTEASQAS